jgi:DNA-binding MarR family transcriptional regulator
MDAVAVSRAVNRLLRAGRLRRAIARDDRRRSVLQVSEAGASVYREVAPMALEFERSLIEALPASERAILDRAIGVLMQRAENLSMTLRVNGKAPAEKRRLPRSAPRHRVSR